MKVISNTGVIIILSFVLSQVTKNSLFIQLENRVEKQTSLYSSEVKYKATENEFYVYTTLTTPDPRLPSLEAKIDFRCVFISS